MGSLRCEMFEFVGSKQESDAMEPLRMETEQMELVGVTHVGDAITFWGQNVDDENAVDAIVRALCGKCDSAPKVQGPTSTQKIYAARYSEDQFWYRCRVQQQQTEDKFQVFYVDYGNSEEVERSVLVELPDELQSAPLAKKYRFWGFHIPSDQDAACQEQGKTFLLNLINGKKLRLRKKSVCFDGTILVQAYQGNLNVGDEVLKMQFARFSVPPGGRDGPLSPPRPPQAQDALWPLVPLERAGQGDADNCLPRLRPTLTEQAPQVYREKSTATSLLPANSLKKQVEMELLEESEQLRDELQRLQKEVQSATEEKKDLQEENSFLQQRVQDLNSQLQQFQQGIAQTERVQKTAEVQATGVQTEHVQTRETQTERVQTTGVQIQTERVQTAEVQSSEAQTEHMQMPLMEQLSCLANKVESVRRLRASNSSSTVVDTLLEAVDVVVDNRISAPAVMETLEVVWAEFENAQEKLKACSQREELGALMAFRDRLREELSIAVATFLQETNKLPITERTHTLEELLKSMRGVCAVGAVGSVLQQGAFEELRHRRSLSQKQNGGVCHNTDRTLSNLCLYLTKSLDQLLCVSEQVPACVSDVCEGVDMMLLLAESAVAQELEQSSSVQGQSHVDSQLISATQHSLLQLIQTELALLRDIRDKHTLCSQFKQLAAQWLVGPPSLAELLSIKKQIRSLNTQLRWKQMEASVMEEAEEPDLMEVLKKKEEITGTRKALFKSISAEQREYEKLVALTKNFPELPLLHPDADILTYMRSGGMLLKSLDRDMLDTEPLRELSGRRPLLCSEFLGQRVILKGYCVEADAEEKVLARATLFGQTQKNCPHLLPLLGLFYGKNDPLAYVMVPYLPNSSLRMVQKRSPLTSSEVVMAMRGVALGLGALHSAGITHGALHPGNVFVTNREQGIVGDYDLTKTAEQRAVDGVMKAGNISLLSPERQQGSHTHTTAACDMYAYGGLLLWLNHPDFDGTMNPDSHTPDMSALNLVGAPYQHFLFRLLIGCGRLLVADVLAEQYFLTNQNTALE
ncbi:serine/threonine-protein kinase 31-like [Alosa alosa]|uniref:serine/threonine-protein kinase 31-like n=1 Tax=Alosa alosa TaxID=278164 RepID=UPI00201527BE|nr:serine/threonine-protein kinase 31-like [Alosa alosa]